MQLSLFEEERKEDPKQDHKRALLIDGNNVLNRAFYATAMSPVGKQTTLNGVHTNGVKGFIRMMLRYKKELQITHLAVFFDKGKGFRSKLYGDYKATRKQQPMELSEQFPLIEEVLKNMGVPVFYNSDYEADDLISSAAKVLQSDMVVYTLSNDKDLFQIITDRVIQIVRKGSADVFYDKKKFLEDYEGLNPKQIIDLKAMEGDTADNIPGIHGIGEKGAKELLHTFGTIEAIMEAIPNLPKELNRYKAKLAKGKEEGLLFKKMVTLNDQLHVLSNTAEICCKDWNMEALKKDCVNLGMAFPKY